MSPNFPISNDLVCSGPGLQGWVAPCWMFGDNMNMLRKDGCCCPCCLCCHFFCCGPSRLPPSMCTSSHARPPPYLCLLSTVQCLHRQNGSCCVSCHFFPSRPHQAAHSQCMPPLHMAASLLVATGEGQVCCGGTEAAASAASKLCGSALPRKMNEKTQLFRRLCSPVAYVLGWHDGCRVCSWPRFKQAPCLPPDLPSGFQPCTDLLTAAVLQCMLLGPGKRSGRNMASRRVLTQTKPSGLGAGAVLRVRRQKSCR